MSKGIIVLIELTGTVLRKIITQTHNRSGAIVLEAIIGLVVGALVVSPSKVVFGKKEYAISEKLTCVSECNSNDPLAANISLEIMVMSFTFDPTNNQTLMRFSVKSERNESNCHFESDKGFAFQDMTGKTYLPSGQLKNGGSFSLVKGKPIILTAIYSFSPPPDATYTLRPGEIYCDGHSIGYTPTYGDVQFTFPADAVEP